LLREVDAQRLEVLGVLWSLEVAAREGLELLPDLGGGQRPDSDDCPRRRLSIMWVRRGFTTEIAMPVSVGPENRLDDRKAGRAVHQLARFLFISQTHQIQPEQNNSVSTRRVRAPVSICLYALGYQDVPVRRLLAGVEGYAELLARLHVDYGEREVQLFHFWESYQTLLSLLNQGCTETQPGRFVRNQFIALEEWATQLDVASDLAPLLQPIRDELGRGVRLASARAAAARDLLVGSFTSAAEERLGLVEFLHAGKVPGSALTYPTVYRLARHLGHLRAAEFERYDTDLTDHERARRQFELWTILDRLDVPGSVPRTERAIRRALSRLLQPLGEDQPSLVDLWYWIDSFLEVVFGGQADVVYRLAYERGCFPFFVRHADQLSDLAGKCLPSMEEEARLLGSTLSFDDVKAAVRGLSASQPLPAGLEAVADTFTARLDDWLVETVPLAERGPVAGAKTALHADTFKSYWLPVDAARIDAFVQQFPSSLQWVGEAILDAVDYYDERFFVNALSALVRLNGWAGREDVSLCLLGGARKSGARMSYLLRRDLELPYQELRTVLSRRRRGQTIVFLDDCSLTGTQARHIFAELLGVWDRPPKYELVPLTAAQKANLRACRVALATAVGSNWARHRLREFFTEHGLQGEIHHAHSIAVLSEQGMRDLGAGTLVDESKSLRDPVRQLGDPLFCPWSRLAHPGRWEEARDFCATVGYALLERIAADAGWTEHRRRASALGYSGIQGGLVFSHNVPRSCLTLLWASGVYRGRPWIPLFPVRD